MLLLAVVALQRSGWLLVRVIAVAAAVPVSRVVRAWSRGAVVDVAVGFEPLAPMTEARHDTQRAAQDCCCCVDFQSFLESPASLSLIHI